MPGLVMASSSSDGANRGQSRDGKKSEWDFARLTHES
jgi:hypothetical protein